MSLSLSTCRTLEIKVRHNKSRCIQENDKKNKRSKKVWVHSGTDFRGSFSTLCLKNDGEVYGKLLARKIRICGKKYTIAQEFDIQVFRGQIDILVY